MKNILLCLSTIFFLFSCRNDSSDYEQNLKNNIKDFNKLLTFIEKNYCKEFKNRRNDNLIIFTNCENENSNYGTIVCDAKDVLKQMNYLNITEISFEKYSENCNENFGFNQVNFKLEKGSLDSNVFFRYEYCGTTKEYISKTIQYIPIDKNWSVFIDSNI